MTKVSETRQKGNSICCSQIIVSSRLKYFVFSKSFSSQVLLRSTAAAALSSAKIVVLVGNLMCFLRLFELSNATSFQ